MSQKKYLLDSNICIHLLRKRPEIVAGIKRVGWSNCCLSEMTVVELIYGAECSMRREENLREVEAFVASMTVLPLSTSIHEFCHQKAELRRQGLLIEDFDMFIGCTAVANDCIMVTENVKHMSRIEGIILENWVMR